ncbi:hypothetical protein J6590_037421 [Homalodisca vitripennis]|nr:hypothetical protein J6590_037421 [Homalodisca vitripennis]
MMLLLLSILQSVHLLYRTDPEEFAWVYTAVRHTNECYNDLPVIYRNASRFLKSGSRLLVEVGKPVPSSAITPVLYLLDGVWMKIGGESYIAPSPVQLSPNPADVWKYGDIKTMRNIGFLSKKQLE